MVKPRFGRLVKVNIQGIWNEGADEFVVWLSDGQNLAFLGEALAFDLQLAPERGLDAAMGHLLCRDNRSGHHVLIGSPSGKTDPSQFGQILMSAAGLHPVEVVWMAGQFTEEHCGLVEWLNQITADTVNFYGLEVEFWQIGDSPLAPRFSPVCGPFANAQASFSVPGELPVELPEMPIPSFQKDGGVQDNQPAGGMLKQAAQKKGMDTSPRLNPIDPPDKGKTPSGMLREAAGPQDELPDSASLREFQASKTTVTPSGMLARLQIREDDNDSGGMLGVGLDSELTDTQRIYVEFWTKFWEDVVKWESDLPAQRPMSQGWVTFPIGRENFYLIAFLSAEHNLAGLGLVMDGPDSKHHFDILFREKDVIEAEIGSALDWRELPSKNESHVYLHRRDVDPNLRDRWVDYQSWFAESLETFTHVLGTRVRTMDSDDFRRERSFFSR